VLAVEKGLADMFYRCKFLNKQIYIRASGFKLYAGIRSGFNVLREAHGFK
jgi:hypothetical protein